MSLIIPQNALKIEKPQEIVSEHDKFKDSGLWFLQYGRWIINNYYNTYSAPASDFGTQASNFGNGGIVNGQGSNVSWGTGNTTSLVDEMLNNYSYFYGNQDNRIFNFLTKGVNNNQLPNVFLKGQEVRSLASHIQGKCLQMINPIEKNISCETISQNSVVKRQEVFDKIDMAAKIAPLLNELGGGVKYQPAGDIDYNNPAAIEEAKKKVRAEYENTATIIGRNAYYKCNLAETFMNVASDTIICNLAGIEFTEKDGEMVKEYVPGYQGIFDYSTWGEYGEGQTLGGKIMPVTIEELIHKYPDMNAAWRNEMEDVLYRGVDGSAQFMDYYNEPFTNVFWWYNDQKWMSLATVYWLNECELPYVEKTNQFGGRKVQKIDAYKTYQVPTTIDGKKSFESKKGYDLKGSGKVWKVHKAVIAGNKYLLEYGYDTYQVRPFGDKKKPEIPIKFFCQGKLAGYVKSIVSRLKTKQDELDALRYRIREHVATDTYGIFVNGAKLTETLSALNIINDLRTLHVSVIPSTGDEELDKRPMEDIIKVVENHAVQAIRDYLVLKQDIEKEMGDILNIPPVALGEQSGVIGKGVQEATINRSEVSGLPFYSSMMEYFRRVLQYASNKNKMILLDNQDKKIVLPISNREIKILELTKDFNYEDLNVYLSPDDQMQVADMNLLRQTLQSYSQNPNTDHAKAILNSLKLMRSKSFQEGIAMFEEFIKAQQAADDKKQMRESAIEHQQKAYQNMSDALDQSKAEMAKLTQKLAEINLKGAWSVKQAEVNHGLDMEKEVSSKIIEEVTKQLGALNLQGGQNISPAQGGQSLPTTTPQAAPAQ